MLRSLVWAIALVIAAQLPAATPLGSLPIREVTVFKDGHAFVQHSGNVVVNDDGHVELDRLPAPVIGTFWAASADERAELVSATAGCRRVEQERTATTVRELLEANVGARIIVHVHQSHSYPATILDIPAATSEDDSDLTTPTTDPSPMQPGNIILLRTHEGVKSVPIDTIQQVTFLDEPARTLSTKQLRNVLSLRFRWDGDQPVNDVGLQMTYLQKGVRWIPQYRITLQPDGQALVEVQATVINELADLENVRTHLVVGVPNFYFKETLDPLALDQTLRELSSYFQQADPTSTNFLSNSIIMQTQVVRSHDNRPQQAEGEDRLPAELSAAEDDLYLFTVENLSLRRGERMILSLGKWTVPYEDLYRLTLPLGPPPNMRHAIESQQQADVAEMLNAPRVMHIARLKNTSDAPFTTGPALLIKDGRITAQGLMTYTSMGASVDLELTAAVNVSYAHSEDEVERTPNAASFGGHTYDRIDVAGTLSLTNHHDRPIRVEIERQLPGVADQADAAGRISRPAMNAQFGRASSYGLRLSLLPSWWHHLNTVSRITWTVEIPPGESRGPLTYKWHYFGR